MSGAPAGDDAALERLREMLLARGGLVARLVDGDEGAGVGEDGVGAGGRRGGTSAPRPADSGSRPAGIAASGPRAEGRSEEYELLVEAIYEGYLLHYGVPRLVRAHEPDLGLLVGDQLYAIGLARLVALGDTHAVAELADTITLSALAQAEGDAALADAVWEAGARAVGWGPSDGHARAKELLREGAPEALAAMRTSAQVVASAG